MPSSLFFNWLNQYCITVLLSGAAWQWEDFGSYASSQDSPPCIVPVFISKYRGFHGGWLSSEMGKGKVEGWWGGTPYITEPLGKEEIKMPSPDHRWHVPVARFVSPSAWGDGACAPCPPTLQQKGTRISSVQDPEWVICGVVGDGKGQTCANDSYKHPWPALIFPNRTYHCQGKV